MKKYLKLLLPIMLLTSCDPIEINVAYSDATMADIVLNYLNNDWRSDIFYKDVDIKDAAIAQFVSSIADFDVSNQLDPYTYIITNHPVEPVDPNIGKLGITSTNTFNYPVISDIKEESPAYGILEIGDIVYGIGLEKEGKIEYEYVSNPLYNFSTFFNQCQSNINDKVYYKIYRYEDNKLNLHEFSFNLVKPFEERTSYIVNLDVEDTLMIKITGFDEKTEPNLDEILKANEESENKKHNLVIDLRDNGGGRVSSALDLLDHFVEKNNKLLSICWKNDRETIYKAEGKKTHYEFDKYVVLVNENTASASEITLKALDYYLGDNLLIIGNKTFGKGLVTNTVKIDKENRFSLQYLAGKWLDPKDEYMEYKTGINPDVLVSRPDYLDIENKYNGYINYNENIKFDTVASINYQIAEIFNAKFDATLRTDGYFDAKFENCVKEYQDVKKLESTGIIDEMTYLNLVYDLYIDRKEFDKMHIKEIENFTNG